MTRRNGEIASWNDGTGRSGVVALSLENVPNAHLSMTAYDYSDGKSTWNATLFINSTDELRKLAQELMAASYKLEANKES